MVRPTLLLVCLLSTGSMGPAAAGSRLEVVVSLLPLQWLVEEIGGDRIEVSVLVTPGESPTTYMPSDQQVTHLMRARIFFSIGAPFERGLWFDAVSRMGRFMMVDLRQGIELQGEDPHIWLSPRLLEIQARTVAEALAQVDPGGEPSYLANLERLTSLLEALDSSIRARLAPFEGRQFFVFHPSWGYFASEYALQQVAIESGGREPSDEELTRLQVAAREARVTTVFVQPQIHGRSARAFADAIGARVEILDPLEADVAANLDRTTTRLVEALGAGASSER